jgi:acetyl esterase/lipase
MMNIYASSGVISIVEALLFYGDIDMNRRKTISLTCLIKLIMSMPLILLIASPMAYAELSIAPGIQPDKVVTYKVINDTVLKLHIFNPIDHKAGDNKPAIVFFFGGGWTKGTPKQFYEQSQYLASRGMVAISAEYRIKHLHNTSPKESVKDSKSAMRWVRSHAKELGINAQMIAAGGGSAGGHLAIATAVLKDFNEDNENLSVSARPDALALFNPAFDNGPGGVGYNLVKNYWRAFSPIHNLDESVPPSIVFLGTEDKLIPVETVELFKHKMEQNGRRCDLFLYEGQPHGFFNTFKKNNKYEETLFELDKFLVSLGYLSPNPI